MTIVNDNNYHGHAPCCSDKHRHRSDVGMWHVINHEEYKLYKCHNYIINVAQVNFLTQHDQLHHTFMLCVSTLAPSPAFPTGTAIGGTFDEQ